MKQFIYLFALLFLCLNSAQCAETPTDYLTDFPKGCSPREVGAILSQRFIPSKHMLHGDKWIHYAEVCTWYGALRYAQAAGDKKLIRQLQDRFEPLFSTEKQYQPVMNHVDLNMFGCLPLEFYKVTEEKKSLDLGMLYADTQWTAPADAKAEEKVWADKGLSWQTRLWIDDMFMITIIQAQAYHVTGKRAYIDRAAKEMVVYLDELQRPNGLFYHAPDVPFFWGRGNGWMDAGEYGPAARKAWIALVSYINKEGDVEEVCVGTNKKNDLQYYYDRPRIAGDYHGQAPYLWCAFALLSK